VPQVHTFTFVKALSDPSRQVLLEAIIALTFRQELLACIEITRKNLNAKGNAVATIHSNDIGESVWTVGVE
jgi:hypothetical protein